MPQHREDSSPVCSLCGYRITIVGHTSWVLAGHEEIALEFPVPGSFYLVADTSLGELTICGGCYQSLPSYLTDHDRAIIHYSAGLTYGEEQEHLLALKCHERAASIERSADVLASMAVCCSELGRKDEAIRLNKEALQLAPDHFIALENLKRLESQSDPS